MISVVLTYLLVFSNLLLSFQFYAFQSFHSLRRNILLTPFASKEPKNSENDESSLNSFRKPLIKPNSENIGSFPSISDNKPTQKQQSPYEKALASNWKYGLCKHITVLEAAEIVVKVRFTGDIAAVGLLDGRVCLIHLTTQKILDRFREHEREVSQIEYTGDYLVSGGLDGNIVRYNMTMEGSMKSSGIHWKLKLHTRAIMGIRLYSVKKTSSSSISKSTSDLTYLVIDSFCFVFSFLF
jgi:hypothetical protein